MGCNASTQAGGSGGPKPKAGKLGKKPTFGYWPIRAGPRGMVNRYILTVGGQDWEDHRFEKEEWETGKNPETSTLGLDFPNLPHVINGGFKLSESKAVSWYLCAKYSPELLGTGPQESATVRMLQEIFTDMFFGIVGPGFKDASRDPAREKSGVDAEKIAVYLGDKNFCLGDKCTLADLIVMEYCITVNAILGNEDLWTAQPKLKAHHDRMIAMPKLAAFMETDAYKNTRFFPQSCKYDI